MYKSYNNIKKFFKKNKGKIFRIWNKEAEGQDCDFVYIREVINLPNGDYLLGYSVIDDRYENNMYPYIFYAKFSEIEIAYSEADNSGV